MEIMFPYSLLKTSKLEWKEDGGLASVGALMNGMVPVWKILHVPRLPQRAREDDANPCTCGHQ